MDQVHEGGCGCGAVRFRVEGQPIYVNNCHCRLCQRQTGSTGVVNAFYESDRLTVLGGDLAESTFTSGSGGEHVVSRCAACGTALFSYYPRVGRAGVGIRVGAFDEPGAFRPDAVVFTGNRMPWVALPEGIPAFEAYYRPSELLPPERFARLMALVERGN